MTWKELEELKREAYCMGVPVPEIERAGTVAGMWPGSSPEGVRAQIADRLRRLIKVRPFVEVFTWTNRPEWVDALPGIEAVIDPYYVIVWRGKHDNGRLRVGWAMDDAERMAAEVFDTGCPWYTWISEPISSQGKARVASSIPCDAVVVVTNS